MKLILVALLTYIMIAIVGYELLPESLPTDKGEVIQFQKAAIDNNNLVKEFSFGREVQYGTVYLHVKHCSDTNATYTFYASRSGDTLEHNRFPITFKKTTYPDSVSSFNTITALANKTMVWQTEIQPIRELFVKRSSNTELVFNSDTIFVYFITK